MYRYLLPLFCYCLISPVFAQTDAARAATESLRDIVTSGQAVGIAAGALSPRGSLFQEGYGLADEKAATPFTATTISRTASITKVMTAVAIMQLVEQDRVALDATVGTYLPAFREGHLAQITVRQVLGHTSGIRAYANDKEGSNTRHYPDLGAAFGIVAEDPLDFAPGSDFGYSSYGYNALGLLIEEVSGMAYADYLQRHVWAPAGMTHTSVERLGEAYRGKSVRYHLRKPGKFRIADDNDLSDRIPGGGVQSTVTDLLKFGDALLRGDLISAASLAAMATDNGLKKKGNPYGMGLYLYGSRPDAGKIIGHTGAQLGCSAVLLLLPEHQATIVVLSNTSRSEGVFPLGVRLIDLVAAEAMKE